MTGTPTHQDDPDPREIPGHRKAWIGAARQAQERERREKEERGGGTTREAGGR